MALKAGRSEKGGGKKGMGDRGGKEEKWEGKMGGMGGRVREKCVGGGGTGAWVGRGGKGGERGRWGSRTA